MGSIRPPMRHGLLLALLLCASPLISGRLPRIAHAQGTPSALVTAVDDAGTLVPGACFKAFSVDPDLLFRPAGISTCDIDDGALDGYTTIMSGDGRTALYQVAAGDGFRVGSRTEFDAVAGVAAAVAVPQQAGGRTVSVRAVDDAGLPVLVGDRPACFQLGRDDGVGRIGEPVAEHCVAPGGSAEVFTMRGVPPGDYLLGGFATDDLRQVETTALVRVRSDDDVEVEVGFEPYPAGRVVVRLIDEAGAPVLGACMDVERTTTNDYFGYFLTCDADYQSGTPEDGVIELDHLADGRYALEPFSLPPGFYPPSKPLRVAVRDGVADDQTMVVPAGAATLTVTSTFNATDAYTTACLAIRADDEPVTSATLELFACLEILPDGSASTTITLPPGDYVVESYAPFLGQAPVPDQRVSVTDGEAITISLPSAPAAVVEVVLVDEGGDPSTGCIELVGEIDGFNDGRLRTFSDYGPACDFDDGAADGRIRIGELPAGTFNLLHIAAPRGQRLAAPSSIKVEAGESVTATVESTKGGGRAVVSLDDARKTPPDAEMCVRVYRNDAEEPGNLVTVRCDGHDGSVDDVVALAGLPAGDYLLTLGTHYVSFELPEISPVAMTIVDGDTTKISVDIPADE